MKKNSRLQLFFFAFAWIYRFFCLVLTFFIFLSPSGQNGAGTQPFRLLVYFSCGTVFFILFHRRHAVLLILFVLDYFAVLLFQYFEPHYMFLEHLWLPGILLAIALSAPFPLSILLSLVMGIPGGLFLNYASFTGVVISISGQNYLYADIAPFFYVPVTLLTVMTGIINFYCGKIRDKSDRLELLVSQINKMNKDITGKIFRIQNDTTLEERKRISKEIHDTSGYVFINLIMILQAASAVLYKDLKKTEQLIDDAIDYADKGINEIRHKLRGIREYTHAFLSLQNELFDIGESFRKTTGVTLTIEYGNWPKTFSKTTDSFFLSFMQECLTNALKHGQASAITIMCWMTDSYIVMSITDNGKGAVMPIKKGIGISAMEDFVSSYNGSINIRSDEGGFRITAVLPLTEPIQS